MRVALPLLVVLLAGCVLPASSPGLTPVLDRPQAERLALRADEVLRAALAGHGAEELAGVFRGQALSTLRLQVARLVERGLHIEERNVTRQLVRFDRSGAEAVLAVGAEHRLTTRDQSDPAWAATEREWWMRFAFEAGAWWIVDQGNLPPDRWVHT